MVLAYLVAPYRWRGLRFISRSFADKLIQESHPRARERYPLQPPNPAVFEDAAAESAATPTRPPPRSRSHVLETIVKKQDWTLATRIRDEMLEDGLSITPHTVYEHAALASLLQDNPLPSFTQWLQLYPHAEVGSPDSLRSLRNILLQPMMMDPTIVFEFGLLLAQKGYITIVKQEVIPCISRFPLPTQVKESMLRRLQTLLLPPVLDTSPSTSFLEEEDLSDYTTFVPTPSTQTDANPDRTPASTMIAHLEKLVEQHDIVNAGQVLEEVQDFGYDVPTSPLYANAAAAVLHPDYRGEASVADFQKWFSLVPSFYENPNQQFNVIRQRLFWSPNLNMQYIVPFLLICARKGYASFVIRNMDALRYGSDDVVASVFRELQNSTDAYAKSVDVKKYNQDTSEYALRKLQRRMLFVLAKGGRHELAAKVLRDVDLSSILPNYAEGLTKASRAARKEARPVDDTFKAGASSVEGEQRIINLLELASFAIMSLRFETDTFRKFDSVRDHLTYLRRAAMSRFIPHPWTVMNFYQSYTDTGRTRALNLLRVRYFRTNYAAASVLLFTEMVWYFRLRRYKTALAIFAHNFYVAGVPRMKIAAALAKIPPSQVLPQHRAVPTRGKIWPLPVHSALAWQCLAIQEVHPAQLEKLYSELLGACRGDYQVESRGLFAGAGAGAGAGIVTPAWKKDKLMDASAFTPFLRKLMQFTGVARGIHILNDMADVGLTPTIYHYTEVAAFAAKTGDTRTAFFLLHKMEEMWHQRGRSEVDQDENVERGEGTDLDASHIVEDHADFNLALALESPPQGRRRWGTAEAPPQTAPLDLKDPMESSASGIDVSADLSRQSTSSGLEASPELHADNTTTPIPDALDPASYEDDLARPSFVFYVALMRGFLINRDFESLQEVHERFRVFFTPEPGEHPHLDKLYADWKVVTNGGAYDKRRPKYKDVDE